MSATVASNIDVQPTKKAKIENEFAPGKVTGNDPYKINNEFLMTLLRARVEQIHPNKENQIFVAAKQMLITDVFKGLIDRHIMAVPVLQGKQNRLRYYGFIDLADIVRYIVKHFGEAEMAKYHDKFWDIIHKEETFKTKTVKDVMTYPLQKRNPFHPVKKGYTLFSAIEALAREKSLRRLPVVDEKDQLVGVITQSMIVSFLNANINSIGDLRNKPVALMVDADHVSVSVKDTDTALHAFNVMMDMDVSGLPVVDDKERLISSISFSDLKVLGREVDFFFRLSQPIREFLNKEGANRPQGPVFVTMRDTFETVLGKCMQFGIHRVYVVDDPATMVPLTVISLRDLLLQLVNSA